MKTTKELVTAMARKIAEAIDGSGGNASDEACRAAAVAALSVIIKPVSVAPREVVLVWTDGPTDLLSWNRIMRPDPGEYRWWADLPDMGRPE